MRRVLAPMAIVLSLLLSMVSLSPANAQETPQEPIPVTGAEENLGHAIPGSFLAPESTLGVDEDGRLLAFYVSNGNAEVPIMLQVLDVEKQEMVFQQRATDGANSWAVAWSDVEKRVYFASTEGHFYSWKPGETDITDYGVPFKDEGIWRLTVAPDGIVFGGTYPGGKLISFDPSSEEFTDHGQVRAGETYARGLAADEDHVYVGTQPNATISRMDRATGEFTPMEMPLTNENAAYDMTLVPGRLFVRIESSNTLLVYDTETLEVIDTVEKITGRVISGLDPTGTFVVFRMNNGSDPTGIYKYTIADGSMENMGFNPNAFPGSFLWYEFDDQENLPGHTLVMTYYRGRTYARNFESRKGLYIGESIMEFTPNPIQEIGTGPDGKIYVPGFLSPPSMAQFDPATDEFTQLAGAGQVEGLGIFDDYLLMGRYPNGLLTKYDTTQPWANGTNPPAPFEIGYEQDRPQSLVRVGDEVAVSSIPKSGRLGGAITMWDPATDETRVYQGIFEQQAPVSLVELDGLLYVGTTINGGYGIDPVATEAKLLIMDPASGEILFETVPVAGASNVASLRLGPDGKLWANADGTMIVFDPETREVECAEQIFPRTRTMYGTEKQMLFHDDGYLYATSGGSLWRVDTETFETIRMATNGVKYIAQDGDGRLYYARVSQLFRWDFDAETGSADLLAPVTTAEVTADGGAPSDVAVTLTATDEGTGVASTEYRIDGGDWVTYEGPISFEEAGSYAIEYRSRDTRGNIEGIQTIEVTVVVPKVCVLTAATAGSKLLGTTTSIWGTATECEGETVTIEVERDGEWVSLGEATVGEGGFYALELGELGERGTYTLRAVVGETVSDEVTLTRIAATTAAIAETTVTGRTANVWGTVDGKATVYTQVNIPGRGWTTSQSAEVEGFYAIPLTYGANTAGTYEWRVLVRHEHGQTEVSEPMTQERLARPLARTAGEAPVGRTANVWGTLDVDAPTTVWTEVQLADGRWVRSQSTTSTASGWYVIELTYGKHAAGTLQWRVAAEYEGVGVVRSEPFSFVRG